MSGAAGVSEAGGASPSDLTRSSLVPLLETDRLRLRAHRASDYEALKSIWSDPQVYRHIGGQPSTPEASWMRLLLYAGLWGQLGYGYWAIEEKATGLYIGDIGYADFHRAIDPPLDGMPELGWVLASAAQGKGYATEALKAVLAWGETHFGEHQACCIISPENTPSLRLADKIGFRFSRPATFHERAVHIFIR